jgi:AcrR family transcriptional regulator
MGRTRSDGKRRQIMKAAEGLFATHRFHESTLDDVARHAGVGKGTIYLYFKDKDDLFFQTAVAGFDDLCAVLRRETPDAPFPDRILRAIQSVHEFMDARRKVFSMMQTEDRLLPSCHGTLREQWVAHRRKLVGALADILEEGRDAGFVRKDFPPDTLATLLIGLLRTRAKAIGDALEPLSLEALTDFFFHGAAPTVEVPGRLGKGPLPVRSRGRQPPSIARPRGSARSPRGKDDGS